jgi:hypothetical protein
MYTRLSQANAYMRTNTVKMRTCTNITFKFLTDLILQQLRNLWQGKPVKTRRQPVGLPTIFFRETLYCKGFHGGTGTPWYP